jgi:hypothetical protein
VLIRQFMFLRKELISANERRDFVAARLTMPALPHVTQDMTFSLNSQLAIAAETIRDRAQQLRFHVTDNYASVRELPT